VGALGGNGVGVAVGDGIGVGVGVGPESNAKTADTFLEESMVTTQVPEPEQSPLHDVKW
jgi:hypothetical protein